MLQTYTPTSFLTIQPYWCTTPVEVPGHFSLSDVRVAEYLKAVQMRSAPCNRPTLPVEIWSEVFKHLDCFDLYQVSCTDHFFYNTSIWHLLGNQTWNADRRTVLDECSNPYADSRRDRAVHTLVLRSKQTNTLRTLHGRFNAFTNIHTLHFHNFSFDDDPFVFRILHEFSALVYLSFQSCTIPPCSLPDAITFQSLQIRELDILHITWPRERFSSGLLPTAVAYGILNLLTAPHLDIVRVDWTERLAPIILDPDTFVVPVDLSRVHTLEVAAPYTLPTESVAPEFGQKTSQFLVQFVGLRHLRVMPGTKMPPFPIPHKPLLLRTFHGVINLLHSIDAANYLVDINLYTLVNPHHLAYHMPSRLPSLRSMRITLTHWDEEIIYCATQTFPGVEDLRIQYVFGDGPSADFLFSFTGRFLPLLPNLRVFHAYCVELSESSTLTLSDGFSEMKKGAQFRNLCEVRLQIEAVWRRGSIDSNEWNIRLEWPSTSW